MRADWTADRRRASAPAPPQTHPATHPRRDRNLRRGGSALPGPDPPRYGIFFRFRWVSCSEPLLPSFRGDATRRTRNLEIPRSAIAHLWSGPSDHPGMTPSPLVINPDRPDLDRTKPGAGNSRGDGERGVEILGLDQIV